MTNEIDELSSGLPATTTTPVPTISLNMTADVAKKLYPDKVGSVFCDQHGKQPIKKVHSHLFEIRGSKDKWVCAVCVSEAQATHDEHHQALRKQNEEDKASKRKATKEIFESAKASDVLLATRVLECQNASDNLVSAKVDVDICKDFVTVAREHLASAELALKEVTVLRERRLQQLLADDGALDEAVNDLESAHNVVDICYIALKEDSGKVDSLWDSLGKSARKKRDKTNRKAAVALLIKREGSGDDSNS